MKSDNRVVKASFRKSPVDERVKFINSRCIMPISIGQKVHEGDKFIATIKLINRSFSECIILIDDTVQRHTLAILQSDLSMDNLYTEALRQGDEWLSTYQSHIESQVQIPYKIIRWDKWLNHQKFKESLNTVENRYNSDSNYKEAIDANIFDFLNRLSVGKACEFNWEEGHKNCWNYLMEECAAMCLWIEEQCEYEVYPSERNAAMAATYKTFIEPKTPGLLKPVALRFKKYGLKTKEPLAL